MNELGNSPADKNYKPSGISRAEEAANEIYKDGIELFGRRYKNGNLIIHPETMVGILRNACQRGYEAAEKDIIALIESIIEGIIGDAQPKPILRAELQELNKRIKNNEITKNQGNI